MWSKNLYPFPPQKNLHPHPSPEKIRNICTPLGVQSLETYFSFSKIDKKKNKIGATLDRNTWYNLTFAVGYYEHKDINDELKRQLELIITNYNDNHGQFCSGFYCWSSNCIMIWCISSWKRKVSQWTSCKCNASKFYFRSHKCHWIHIC